MTYVLSYLSIIWLMVYVNESKTVLAEDTLKYVCSGDSIQLFRNVTIDNIDMVVSLRIHASYDQTLAMWNLKNETIFDGYTMKVIRDKTGDIWIRNVSPSDEAQYILNRSKRKDVFQYNVTLRVQVAPTINCKPTITRADDVLVASLNPIECGKPLVSVDWLDYRGIRNEGNEFMLPKANKYGIYYACISGTALECVKTSKLSNYCTAYPISDTHEGQDVSSKSCIGCSVLNYFVVMLIAILLVLVLVIGLFFRSKCKNLTLCGIKNGARDVEKSDYNAVSTTIELSDVSHPPVEIS